MLGKSSDKSGIFKRGLSRFNISEDDLPYLVIEETSTDSKRFVYNGRVTKEAIEVSYN